VFRIRIELNTDPDPNPDPAFSVNTDPAPDSDPGFFMTKMKENFCLQKFKLLFLATIAIKTWIEDSQAQV